MAQQWNEEFNQGCFSSAAEDAIGERVGRTMGTRARKEARRCHRINNQKEEAEETEENLRLPCHEE